uniref:Transposase Helix-turn-helix domain-containing protein n=1 Tax=Amphimedon queenslandica TaxID=400682 RepID=A0A1X7VJJ1_AMPQE
MIVSINLSLNLDDQDIAFRFSVYQSTISRCFNKVIHVLYVQLKPLIKWPKRSELLKTMPMKFGHDFRLCVAIIDCFKVFIERPTNVKEHAQYWWNY